MKVWRHQRLYWWSPLCSEKFEWSRSGYRRIEYCLSDVDTFPFVLDYIQADDADEISSFATESDWNCFTQSQKDISVSDKSKFTCPLLEISSCPSHYCLTYGRADRVVSSWNNSDSDKIALIASLSELPSKKNKAYQEPTIASAEVEQELRFQIEIWTERGKPRLSVGSKNPTTGTTFVLHTKRLTSYSRHKDMHSSIQRMEELKNLGTKTREKSSKTTRKNVLEAARRVRCLLKECDICWTDFGCLSAQWTWARRKTLKRCAPMASSCFDVKACTELRKGFKSDNLNGRQGTRQSEGQILLFNQMSASFCGCLGS